jgi:hypothetical protein
MRVVDSRHIVEDERHYLLSRLGLNSSDPHADSVLHTIEQMQKHASEVGYGIGGWGRTRFILSRVREMLLLPV